MVQRRVGSVMGVGGGFAGMQTAVDLAKRRFANAFWWRLNLLTTSVLSVIKGRA